MNILVSDFISMENLGRKPRVSRCQRARASSTNSKPLHIIVEESEPVRSTSPASSSTAGPAPALKAKRRHCNLSPSEIQIARDFVGLGDDDDVSDREDRLLLVPPSSARLLKNGSPIPSPDSFQLDFTDASFVFPHPPIPTPTSLTSRHVHSFCGSPTTSTASISSFGQPLTPTSSDDEFFDLPSPKFNPRRAAIQPLVICKHMSLSGSPSSRPDFLAPCNVAQPALSPFSSEQSSSDSEPDSESDSEWYHKEMSKIVTVRPPTPPLTQKARPDSIFISHPPNKRISRPSGQLDPAFPKRRHSRHIPSYSPPPVPTIPAHLRPVSHLVPSSPTSPPSSRLSFAIGPSHSPVRPPPRSSVPADFEFDSDSESAFSSGLYQYDEEDASLRSAYSHPSFQSMFESASPLDNAEFDLDLDYPMMLPLSTPGTPIDFETDVATGLNELRASHSAFAAPSPLPSVPEDSQESVSDFSFSPSVRYEPLSRTASRSSFDSFYVTSPPGSPVRPAAPSPTFSTPGPIAAAAAAPPSTPPRFTIEDEERVLKSKWSSSTLGSMREEHERRISSKLRLFSPSKKQRSSPHKALPQTPLSPMSFLTSPSKKHHQKSSSTASAANGGRRESSDMVVIGYGAVRRRGSCTTVSDAGSEDSASSSSSGGLRRKPIPIELFLRN